MICALIGDRTIGNLEESHLEERLRVLIAARLRVCPGLFRPV